MRVAVLGASGVIGQHMRLYVPRGVEPVYFRQRADLLHRGMDEFRVEDFDVVVNLAGESRPDVVERNPEVYRDVNVRLPDNLALCCAAHGKRLVHISTQAVFSGHCPPYYSDDKAVMMDGQVNEYGRQKRDAEAAVVGQATILRPTFVLGIRPMPGIGRRNPLEQILEDQHQQQVWNRYFSVSFAADVAKEIWRAAGGGFTGTRNLGSGLFSRYSLALECQNAASGRLPQYNLPIVAAITHESLAEFGLAERPTDTSYVGSDWPYLFSDSLAAALDDWWSVENWGVLQRARELSIFLGKPLFDCYLRLAKGFGPLHEAVRQDWLRANPVSDDDILHWYRTTESYLWELSAYHADPGWNYRQGTCRGIIDHLLTAGARRVLCLGDGIGDLTLWSRQAGLDAVYHDLADSRTALFARSRYLMYTGGDLPCDMTPGWHPRFDCGPYDAIASLDFLEHVTDVPAWARAIHAALKPGGLLVAQNAFGIGSEGAIPCHLPRNDRFEKDWTPLLLSLGFTHEGSIWWKKQS